MWERINRMSPKQKAIAVIGFLSAFSVIGFFVSRLPDIFRGMKARGELESLRFEDNMCAQRAFETMGRGYLHQGLDQLDVCSTRQTENPEVRALLSEIAEEQKAFNDIVNNWHPEFSTPFRIVPALNPEKSDAMLERIEQFLSKYPDGYYAQLATYVKALQYFSTGQYDKCVTVLSRGQELNAVSDYASYLRAYAVLKQGDHTGAERLIKAYIEKYPGTRMSHEMALLYAKSLWMQGRPEAALEQSRRVAESDAPPFVRGHARVLMSQILAKTQPPQYAMIALVAIAKEYPKTDLDFSLAQTLIDRPGGSPTGMLSGEDMVALGRYFIEKKQYSDVERVISSGSGQEINLLLGKAAYYRGQYKTAIKYLEKVNTAGGEPRVRAHACAFRGMALRKRRGNKDLEHALKTLKSCVSGYPQFSGPALEELGVILRYYEEEKGDEIVRFLQKIILSDIDHGEEVLRLYAMHSFRHGNYQAAFNVYNRLVQKHPMGQYADDALFWMARIKWDAGDTGSAAQYLRRIRSDYPYSYFYFRAGEYLDHLGEPAGGYQGGRSSQLLTHTSDYIRDGYAFMEMGYDEIAGDELSQAAVRGGLDADAAAIAQARLLRERNQMIPSVKAVELRVYDSPGYYATLMEHPRYRELLFPTMYLSQVRSIAPHHNVPPEYVLGVMRQESRFESQATSSSNAKGLMQVIPSTGKWIAGERGIKGFSVDDLYNVDNSIDFGSWYLRRMLDKFGQNKYLAAAAYNGGPGNLNKWLKRTPHDDIDVFVEHIPRYETRDYVKKVMQNYYVYRSILNNK